MIVVGTYHRTPEEKAKDREEFDRLLEESRRRSAERRAKMTPEELEAAERGAISLAEKMQFDGW